MDIQEVFNQLVTGKCWGNFKDKMPSSKQQDTMIKTGLAAVAAGIVTTVATGAFLGFIFAGFVGVGAFAYLTADYGYFKGGVDGVKSFVNKNT